MQHPIYADHGWCPRSTCGNPGSTIDVSGRGNASGQKPRQKRSQRKARSIGKQRSMKQRPTQGVRTPSSHVTLGYIFKRGAAIRQDTLPYLNGRLIIKKKGREREKRLIETGVSPRRALGHRIAQTRIQEIGRKLRKLRYHSLINPANIQHIQQFAGPWQRSGDDALLPHKLLCHTRTFQGRGCFTTSTSARNAQTLSPRLRKGVHQDKY